MEFVKYGSIENSMRGKFIQAVKDQGMSDGRFVVQEKVHGANLAFWVRDKSVRCASRNGWVEDMADFYHMDQTLDGILDPILKAAELAGGEQVVIYGELFGGHYPHPDVPVAKGVSRIQAGICYAPGHQFYAFDVMVDGVYLDVDDANAIFEKAGLFYARTLFEGDFDAALAYENDFQSKLPKWLGLPPIENNVAEGVIIRPKHERCFKNGSRLILKSKNEAWSEKKQRRSAPVVDLSPEAGLLRDEMLSLVTENRFRNLVSKLGGLRVSDMGKVLGMYNKDVLEEFLKDHAEAFAKLEKSEQKRLRKAVNSEASDLIKPLFWDIAE